MKKVKLELSGCAYVACRRSVIALIPDDCTPENIGELFSANELTDMRSLASWELKPIEDVDVDQINVSDVETDEPALVQLSWTRDISVNLIT